MVPLRSVVNAVVSHRTTKSTPRRHFPGYLTPTSRPSSKEHCRFEDVRGVRAYSAYPVKSCHSTTSGSRYIWTRFCHAVSSCCCASLSSRFHYLQTALYIRCPYCALIMFSRLPARKVWQALPKTTPPSRVPTQVPRWTRKYATPAGESRTAIVTGSSRGM